MTVRAEDDTRFRLLGPVEAVRTELPANPYAALQTTISRLRTALELGQDLISTEPNGCRISVSSTCSGSA